MSLRSNDYQPTKGEIVDIVVSEITTKNAKGLFVISMSPIAASKANKVSMDDFDIETEDRVELKTTEEVATTTTDKKVEAFK